VGGVSELSSLSCFRSRIHDGRTTQTAAAVNLLRA
jgi:hypothetical protein